MLDPEQLGRKQEDLAATLKALRKAKGYTGQRLASLCAMSQSKISKIETGKIVPSVVDVERILRALEAPQEMVREVSALARIANTEFQDVRSLYRKGVEKKQDELAGLEKTAKVIRFFLPAMITSLLSTPEYLKASLSHVPGDISKAVAKKIERQEILYDSSKEFVFLLTEAAIKWALCPAPQMAIQIDRLISLSRMPNIRLGVIPLGTVSPRGPLNTFTVYDATLATAETFSGAIIMRDRRTLTFICPCSASTRVYLPLMRRLGATCIAGLSPTVRAVYESTGITLASPKVDP
jgi:transcriptional regulator with XRE-family HTH domain